MKLPIPLHDEVFVLPDTSENNLSTSIEGFEIAGADKEKTSRGTVLAVGPGKIHDVKIIGDKAVTLRAEMSVKAGDFVYHSKHSGYRHKFHGQDVLVLRDSDLMGYDPASDVAIG
jgi:chaperonin GroES